MSFIAPPCSLLLSCVGLTPLALFLAGCVPVDGQGDGVSHTPADSAPADDTAPDSAPDSDSTDTGGSDSTLETGTAAPELEVYPVRLDFETTRQGLSSTLDLQVSNMGSAPVDLAAAITGVDPSQVGSFSYNTDNPVVDAGSVVSLVVTFAPSAGGTFLADLTFGGGAAVVPLSGAGLSDADGDGFVAALDGGDDCDDALATTHPGADDAAYDGVDSNCDGLSDYDTDLDGFDDAELTPDGAGSDCDDADPDIHPLAPEIWYDGIDQDCAGDDDFDADADGHDSSAFSVDGVTGDDCDDSDATIYAGAPDTWYDGTDSDCVGNNDYDQDGDGAVSLSWGGDDCDDTRSDYYPGASDAWYDGEDSDCAGNDDYDQDGDGHESAAFAGDDCDDLERSTYPGASDTWYDGVDSDCALDSDYDSDRDGHDALDWGGDDCDDTTDTVYAGAVDAWYDGIDSDCLGNSDYDADLDGQDSDGHGGPDCDDTSSSVYTGADEVWYDGEDRNCDGADDFDQDADGHDSDAYGGTDCLDTDPSFYPGAADPWYDGLDSDCLANSDFDQDADGHDSDAYGGTDCLDTDPSVYPGAADAWYDGLDSDCLANSDFDQDGDGHDSNVHGGADCLDTDATIYPDALDLWYDGIDSDCQGNDDYDRDEDGYPYDAYDCDDLDPAVHLGAPDAWYDGVDSDCVGNSDFDQDADGWDSDLYGGTDCDDLSATAHVGAPDYWYDGMDWNCDGADDYDRDGDGHAYELYGGDDCNDLDAAIYAGAPDAWYDGVDSDCASNSDYDQDADGVNSDAWGGLDCYDTDSELGLPTAEAWDGIDNDCSGAADDTVANDAYDGMLTGTASGAGLGGVAFWNRGAYLTSSAAADLYLGETITYTTAYAVDGSNLAAEQVVTGVDSTNLSGSGMTNPYATGGSSGDLDGDSNDEVVLLVDGVTDYAIVNYSSGYLWTQSLSSPDLKVSGAETGDLVTSAALGDIDGDGIAELVIGTSADDKPGIHPVTDAGSVSVFQGDPSFAGTAYDQDDGDSIVYGSASGGFGAQVTVSDFDLDGYGDLVVGASAEGPGGAVYLIAGNSSLSWSTTASLSASATIAGAAGEGLGVDVFPNFGDNDGSGERDLLMSASGANRVYLVLDPMGMGSVSTGAADALFDGAGSGINADGSGDTDADGTDDIAIGDPNYGSNSGGVCLILGGPVWSGVLTYSDCDTWFEGASSSKFGSAVFNSIDQDRDGHDDLVVGAQGHDGTWSNEGAVYLFVAP